MLPDSNPRESWQEPRVSERPFLQSPSEGRLVSVSMPASGIQLTGFLEQARGQERFFWGAPENEIVIAGFGVAVQMMAWGTSRYQEIERKAKAIFAEAVIEIDESPLAKPRFFGGFAFRDDFTPDNTWAAFHPAHFFLPHFQLVQAGEESWLTLNAMLPPEEDVSSNLPQLQEALEARLLDLQRLEYAQEVKAPQSAFTRNFPLASDDWSSMLQRAKQQMAQGDLHKVVLSRICEIRFQRAVDISKSLAYLNDNYRDSTRFIFEPKPYHAFFGATPERLVRVARRDLQTMALAGSSQRGRTVQEDTANKQRLLNSGKDRLEHDLVVGSIRRRLEATCDLVIPDNPSILSLSYIHHLYTPIHGRLAEAEGVLPLVERLHPTPALGGSPRPLAMDFIRQNEPVPRGWYAGPIGWVDSELDGEFVVAIRSAVAQKNRVWLYAGAGIVAESDAQLEWLETELKFQPMYEALGLTASSMDQAEK